MRSRSSAPAFSVKVMAAMRPQLDLAARHQGQHPIDQRRGLARSGPGLDEQGGVEVLGDPLTRRLIGGGSSRPRSGIGSCSVSVVDVDVVRADRPGRRRRPWPGRPACARYWRRSSTTPRPSGSQYGHSTQGRGAGGRRVVGEDSGLDAGHHRLRWSRRPARRPSGVTE